MPDAIVVTTDDLEPAVRLRAGFVAAGYEVELLTPSERFADVLSEPVLLVLSGGLQEERARALIAVARQRRLPVLGLVEATERLGREGCRQLGLSECFTKPIDVDEVVLVARRLLERERLRALTGIVGETEVMEEVLEKVVQVAAVDTTVLIEGESGTGKELVARGIHALSRRRERAFVAANVAALPETLLESELFGHERGAFTGATDRRKGLFELAHSGTIFLDEIGEMPRPTQTKLLRVLEEREFRRVGGEELLRVDVRVLTATNRPLREHVELGEFRRDLYHRLNVLRIELPPLRERRADIPRLVEAFVREFSQRHGRDFQGIDPAALRTLVDYDWPGNVRELRNLIESMVVLAPGRVIRAEDIPLEVRSSIGRSRLPVLLHTSARDARTAETPPELEFLLRSLFDLKLDVEDLRREFERYRARHADAGPLLGPAHPAYPTLPQYGAPIPLPALAPAPEPQPAPREEGVVVYRPGMTMEDLEREAIRSALRQVHGNRRKAAEMLRIGERTLYRKIKEYGIVES